jgi:branched-chain amino acid transport system substrate-binding protein
MASGIIFPAKSWGSLALNNRCCIHISAGVLLGLLGGVVCGQDTERSQPFFNARSEQTEYVGPRGESKGPGDVEAVLIGYFGPSDPQHPVAGAIWQAAQQAIRDANHEGGWQGRPFQLVTAWSDDPWGTGVKQLTQLVYGQKVWAVVGGIDGPSTHLAEQVVAKARLVLVSPVSTDKTVNLANVPWMFSLAPHDQLLASLLAPKIAASCHDKPAVLVSQTDHDSHLQSVEIVKQLTERNGTPQFQLKYSGDEAHLKPLVEQILGCQPPAVIVVARAEQAARLVVALREQGFSRPIFGGTEMGRPQFREAAGELADSVVFPLLADPVEVADSPHAADQTTAGPSVGSAKFPMNDATQLLTYDAVRLVVTAIRRAGLNRAEIQRAVRDLSPWNGQAGMVTWDGLGSNTRAPRLGTIRDGRIVRVEVE